MSKSKNRARTRKQQVAKTQRQNNRWVAEISSDLMGYLAENNSPIAHRAEAYEGFALALRTYLEAAEAEGLPLKQAKAHLEANLGGLAETVLEGSRWVDEPFKDPKGVIIDAEEWDHASNALAAFRDEFREHNLAEDLREEINFALLEMVFVAQITARDPDEGTIVVPHMAVWYLQGLMIQTKNEAQDYPDVDPDHDNIVDLYTAYMNLGYALEDLPHYEPVVFPCGCLHSDH